jgi:hypothetical protein
LARPSITCRERYFPAVIKKGRRLFIIKNEEIKERENVVARTIKNGHGRLFGSLQPTEKWFYSFFKKNGNAVGHPGRMLTELNCKFCIRLIVWI